MRLLREEPWQFVHAVTDHRFDEVADQLIKQEAWPRAKAAHESYTFAMIERRLDYTGAWMWDMIDHLPAESAASEDVDIREALQPNDYEVRLRALESLGAQLEEGFESAANSGATRMTTLSCQVAEVLARLACRARASCPFSCSKQKEPREHIYFKSRKERATTAMVALK